MRPENILNVDGRKKPCQSWKTWGTTLFTGLLLAACDTGTTVQVPVGPAPIDPQPNEVIAGAWPKVTEFKVQGMTQYDAIIEVGTRGLRQANGSIRCEFVTEHSRFRTDRPWGNLPIVFYSPSYQSPDGREDLNELFRKTLDFSSIEFDSLKMSVTVTFTRGKVFNSDWILYPVLVTHENKPACSAVASLKKSSQVGCRGDTCKAHRITATVDITRHLLQAWKAIRNIDDLSSLVLDLEELDHEGYPTGITHSPRVPEFR